MGSVTQLVRTALARLARPSLWKRRRTLRVCETLTLGNRNFIAVIGYRDQRFLIGGTPTTIALLAEVDPEDAISAEPEEEESPAA